MMRHTKFLLLMIALSGCGGVGTTLLDNHPELAPHATTWAAIQRKTAEPLPDSFRALIDLAIAQNPKIRAARQSWQAKIEAVGMAGALPDPRLSYTWLPRPVETRVGPNEHRISVTQAIPSIPGLFAQHDGAVARTQAAQAAYDATVLGVLSKLKTVTAEVRYLQLAVQIVDQNTQIAKAMATEAADGFTDGGTLFDVSKARAQLAQLEYDRIRFDELLREQIARLNALLNRDPRATVPQLDAWPQNPAPQSLETLYQAALQTDPKLRQIDAELDAKIAAVSEAKSQLFPDIQLGVQYMANGEARMPDVGDSGEDALGITVGLRIPLFLGKHLSRIGTAEAELAKRVELKQGYINDTLAQIEGAFYRLRNADRLLSLYDTTLLPEAKAAMSNAESMHREKAGYTNFLEARASYYQFSLKRARAATDRVQAEATLERLIGRSLRLESSTEDTP